jgi:hypothetical protein
MVDKFRKRGKTMKVIKRAVVFKDAVGLYVFLHKIKGLYYWFYEDDVRLGYKGMSTVRKAINELKRREMARSFEISFE